MSQTPPDHGMKSFAWGLSTMKKRPELIPLVTIIGGACVGVAAYCVYCFTAKSDIVLNRSVVPPYQRVDPMQPQKLVTVSQEFKVDPKLESLKKELAIYNTKQE